MTPEEIQSNPTGFLQKAKKKEIIDFLKSADEAFFNTGKTLVSDDIYDIIKDYVREKYPKDAYLKRVGADEENKVKLPYYMGSQNKIRDSEDEIRKFQAKYKGSYVISDKLDGISCLVVYSSSGIKIYTRGNGKEGQDISHIIDYVKGIPRLRDTNMAVRGELIISRKNWEKMKKDGAEGANARNVVAGAINSKILNKAILAHIEFIAYSLLNPQMSVDQALAHIKSTGIKIVRHTVVKDLNLNLLSQYLEEWRHNAEYEIDGIVVSDNNHHPITKGKNPEHSFAFKSIHTHEQVEVIVQQVEWNVSKDGYIKPIVKFNEIELDGVKIKQATGFNAAFIEKNKIGAGSRIIIIRSGGVIPHIHSVLTQSASGKPAMPTDVKYSWNDTHVDIIIIKDGKNREYDIQQMLYFAKTLEIENLGQGIITKLYDAGYDSIKKLAHITVADLLLVDGFKDKSATKLYDSIQKIRQADCLQVMDASNMFGRGFGSKRIKLITDEYPFILKQDARSRQQSLKLVVADLTKIKGVSEITARTFLEGLSKFHTFYDELGIKCQASSELAERGEVAERPAGQEPNTMIANKTFVFTGFRDKNLEKYIEEQGGSVKTAVSKNTDYLVVADKSDNSTKMQKAKELGIPIILSTHPMWNTYKM